MANAQAQTSEAPEIRDGEEMNENASRQPIAGVPFGIDGRPMAMIACTVSDKVPTVQFGNCVVGPITITRYIDDLGDGQEGQQHRIDRARELQRDAEFVCGIERRLLQWAVDPASRIQSPVDAQDAFAAPPAGYDPSKVDDPRVAAMEATKAAEVAPKPSGPDPAQDVPKASGVKLG